MGLGTSLVLMAVGAVLRWAVSVHTSGFNLHTIGIILLIVGGVGFIISLIWMAQADDWRNNRSVRRRDDGYPRDPRETHTPGY